MFGKDATSGDKTAAKGFRLGIVNSEYSMFEREGDDDFLTRTSSNKTFYGVAMAFVNMYVCDFYGIQVSTGNLYRRAVGVLFGMFNVGDDSVGLQVGFLNSSRKTTGVQMGLYNNSEYLNGAQMGMVCYAEEGNFWQFGLLTARKHGPWYKRYSPIIGRYKSR